MEIEEKEECGPECSKAHFHEGEKYPADKKEKFIHYRCPNCPPKELPNE